MYILYDVTHIYQSLALKRTQLQSLKKKKLLERSADQPEENEKRREEEKQAKKIVENETQVIANNPGKISNLGVVDYVVMDYTHTNTDGEYVIDSLLIGQCHYKIDLQELIRIQKPKKDRRQSRDLIYQKKVKQQKLIRQQSNSITYQQNRLQSNSQSNNLPNPQPGSSLMKLRNQLHDSQNPHLNLSNHNEMELLLIRNPTLDG